MVPTTVIQNFNAANEALNIKSLAAIGEARLGSRNIGGATYELDVQDHTKNPSGLVQGEKAWTKQKSEALTLNYVASTKTVSLNFGSTSVSSVLTNQPVFDSVWIRVFGQASSGISTTVDSLTLTRGGVTDSLSIDNLSGPQFGFDANALYFTGLDVAKNFTLAGNLTFDWTTDSLALNSRGAIQFKVGETTEAVPEPMSLVAMGAGALALIRRRKASAK